MMCLSIKQPWAGAFFAESNAKDIENREWETHYRGPLLIHASKTVDKDGVDFVVQRCGSPAICGELGAIIGMAWLVDIVTASRSPWFFGRYGWVLKNPIQFTTPIPMKGQLKLYDVPDNALQLAMDVVRLSRVSSDDREHIMERWAIREFDGGLSRANALRMAWGDWKNAAKVEG